MKIGIFGSCVSRDTAECFSESEVVVYVARQSVTSLKTPHGADGVDLSSLSSAFQKRMVTGDLEGDGIARLSEAADNLDFVLIDLVDERRGLWLYENGTTMTNSIELEMAGATRHARDNGARLVEFGSDEHFDSWRSGFFELVRGLKVANIWDRTVMLDIEWATALESDNPSDHRSAKISIQKLRNIRNRIQRTASAMYRTRNFRRAWKALRSNDTKVEEEFASRANWANSTYPRYREFAKSHVSAVVTRTSEEVRIGDEHKWGPQPFHYRTEDYLSFQKQLKTIV